MTYRMQRDTIAYKATCAILEHGPLSLPLLCSFVPMGATEFQRQRNLRASISNGWLVMDREGLIGATSSARKQVLEDRSSANDSRYLEPTPSRSVNMMARPAYKTPRVYRREGPQWAKRPEGFSFKTIA